MTYRRVKAELQLQYVFNCLHSDELRFFPQVKALEAAVVSPSGDPKNSALTRLLSENCTPSDLRSRPVLSSPESVELSTPQVGPRSEGTRPGGVSWDCLSPRTSREL